MLGRDVLEILQQRGEPTVGLARGELDITKRDACLAAMDRLKPKVVINCAAFTDVNGAESREGEAFAVNATGAENIAAAAAECGAACYFVSTDYVFPGTGEKAWTESDPTSPINAYGRSKLEGEIRTRAACPDSAIFRTAWLYGRYGRNFVSTMLDLARAGRDLKVVDDQIGSPTSTWALAQILVDASGVQARGIFHTTCRGYCSWFEFAQAIFQLSGVHPASLDPVSSVAYPTPARRPHNSRLADTRLESIGIAPLPEWQQALKEHLEQIATFNATL